MHADSPSSSFALAEEALLLEAAMAITLFLAILWIYPGLAGNLRTPPVSDTLFEIADRLRGENATGNSRAEKAFPARHNSAVHAMVWLYTWRDELLEALARPGDIWQFEALGAMAESGDCPTPVEEPRMLLPQGFVELIRVARSSYDYLILIQEFLSGSFHIFFSSIAEFFSRQKPNTETAHGPSNGKKAAKPLADEDDKPFAEKVAKQLCKRCQHKRKEKKFNKKVDDLKSMKNAEYCSGCGMHHPLIFFSSRQRASRCERNQVCVAREGSVRLCDHESLTYETVSYAARKLALLKMEWKAEFKLAKCDHDYRRVVKREAGTRGGKRKPKACLSPTAILRKTDDDELELVLEWRVLKAFDRGSKKKADGPKPKDRNWFWNTRRNLASRLFPDIFQEETPQRAPNPAQSNSETRADSTSHEKEVESKSNNQCTPPELRVHHIKKICLGPAKDFGNRCLGMEPIHTEWYEAVDPDSYVLNNDKASEGLFWCKDKECVNHYKESRDMNLVWQGMVDKNTREEKASNAREELDARNTREGVVDRTTKQEMERRKTKQGVGAQGGFATQ